MPQGKNKLIEALGIEKLPERDREEVLARVDKRLQEVLIGVLIANITDEEALKIQQALKDGNDLEETVAQVAAHVPGLAEKIEIEIEEELTRLAAVLKKN